MPPPAPYANQPTIVPFQTTQGSFIPPSNNLQVPYSNQPISNVQPYPLNTERLPPIGKPSYGFDDSLPSYDAFQNQIATINVEGSDYPKPALPISVSI